MEIWNVITKVERSPEFVAAAHARRAAAQQQIEAKQSEPEGFISIINIEGMCAFHVYDDVEVAFVLAHKCVNHVYKPNVKRDAVINSFF